MCIYPNIYTDVYKYSLLSPFSVVLTEDKTQVLLHAKCSTAEPHPKNSVIIFDISYDRIVLQNYTKILTQYARKRNENENKKK